MPRVLLLSVMYPRSDNPNLGIFVQKQAIALAKLLDVGVLAPVPLRPRVMFGNEVSNGFPVWRHAFLSYPGDILRPLKVASVAATCLYAARGIYRRFPFDVIHAHGIAICGFAAMLLGKVWQKPCIITVHGTDTQPQEMRCRNSPPTMQYAVRNADYVVAVSNKIRRDLVSLGIRPDRIAVIPNGVDLDNFGRTSSHMTQLPERPALRKTLLTVANLYEAKGHIYVLESLAQLIRRHPDWDVRYVIVGTGPYERALRARVQELGLTGQVSFLGYVPNEHLASHYESADLFVMPSWSEGFGIAYLESLAMGIPVIACRGQGPEDFVINGVTGYLVPPRNVSALTDTIERALQARWDSARLTAAVQQYTWDRVSKDLYELYDRCIASRRLLRDEPCRL